MNIRKFYNLILAAFFVFTSSNALAGTLESLFDDWHVLSSGEDSEKICYIASVAIDQQGNYKKRSDPYLLVSKFSDRSAEVSVSSGYGYQDGSSVEFTVDGDKYDLRKIQGEVAWAENEMLDEKIITAMKLGNKLLVKGVSTIGSYSIDTYSLKGFSKAYEAMNNLCGND